MVIARLSSKVPGYERQREAERKRIELAAAAAEEMA